MSAPVYLDQQLWGNCAETYEEISIQDVDCPTAWKRLTIEYTGPSHLWWRSSGLMAHEHIQNEKSVSEFPIDRQQ